MGDLGARPTPEVTILDLEASIEHLTRGTVRNVDALLVVTEPYYRSLETAGRMVPLARELGLDRVWVVANKVRDARDEAAIREYGDRRGFEILAVVPFDENVTEADRQGRALLDVSPDGRAVAAVRDLAGRLLNRFGQSVPVAT